MDKPIFMLDVDGVSNAFDAWVYEQDEWLTRVTGKPQYSGQRVAPQHLVADGAAGFGLLLDPRHKDWIAEIEAAGFDMVWGTMWQESAGRHFAPVAGYGHDWEYVPFSQFRQIQDFAMTGYGVGSFKWPGITAVLGDDLPGIWVDDDMEDWQIEWAEARTAAGVPTLFLRPDPVEGMTREHVDQVLAFAAQFASETV